MIFIYIILIIFSLIILLWQISNLISVFSGSLYIKTDPDLIKFALKKANLKQNDIFYDLGCGNGDVVNVAAKMGSYATGYEISPFYYLLSKLRTFNNSKIKIKFQNIKKVDLSKADVVYCYLLPKLLSGLKNKFLKDAPKTIISIGFEIKGLSNPAIYHYKKHTIFIYSLRSRSV